MTAADIARIEATLRGGGLGIAARGPGGTFFHRADELFPTASCIKIAIVNELFWQAADGQIDPERTVTVRAEDCVGGSGVLATLAPGLSLSLADLATLAITVSDNTASNLVLDAVGGPEAVNRRLRGTCNLTRTTIHRPIRFALGEGDPPHTATGTPRDFLHLLGQLRPEVWQRMEAVTDTAMIPRTFDATFVAANKPGAVTGVRNDVGRIRRGAAEMYLAVFTSGCPDPRWTVDNAGCLAVAEVARILSRHLLGDG